MPTYEYRCSCGKKQNAYRTVEDRNNAPVCHGPMARMMVVPYVMGEIEAFRTVNWDQETKRPVVINSRAQRREFMKRNDLIEVGNEPIRKSKNDWNDAPDAPMVSVEELKRRGFVEENY
jgi:hypothetical protein